ncbi:MAG: ammonium transporter [Hyperthermus sp.]|nr:MAG: ammonium transporter [Hyperthermus sp.]
MGDFNTGDTAWVLMATSMVVLMTMGLGFFYGGMVRRKNVVSMISLSFISMVLVSIQWIIIGYTLSFGPSVLGFMGGLKYALLHGISVSQPAPGAENLPHLAFVVFQAAFAAITLAIVTSAVAERAKLSAFLVFGVLWTTLVYDPVAHWVWGGGWLHTWLHHVLGVAPLDFAGGTVVHVTSGFSALALALAIGKRIGYGEYSMVPHNIPLTLIGAALLWFGWFGFNAGSALAANASAANALLTTHAAASAGALAWLLASWLREKPGALGLASGAVAGLVAITPAAGYVDVDSALVIGAVAGVACYAAMLYRVARGLDESLDAWAVHGMGGLWGAIATGIFARRGVGGAAGLIEGNIAQFAAQVVDVAVTLAYSMAVTYVLAKIVDRTLGLRVTQTEEYIGLDVSQHGEEAYAWGG